MDKFPEILEQTSDLELVRTRKELAELKARVEKYEQILKENDLLDTAPVVSDTEALCFRELQKYNEISMKNIGLTLEDLKVIDLLHKNLLLARGKTPVVVEKKTVKEEKKDVATLLKIAGVKGFDER